MGAESGGWALSRPMVAGLTVLGVLVVLALCFTKEGVSMWRGPPPPGRRGPRGDRRGGRIFDTENFDGTSDSENSIVGKGLSTVDRSLRKGTDEQLLPPPPPSSQGRGLSAFGAEHFKKYKPLNADQLQLRSNDSIWSQKRQNYFQDDPTEEVEFKATKGAATLQYLFPRKGAASADDEAGGPGQETNATTIGDTAQHSRLFNFLLCERDDVEVLYFGHSHVVWLNQVSCQVAGYKNLLSSKTRGTGCPGALPFFSPFGFGMTGNLHHTWPPPLYPYLLDNPDWKLDGNSASLNADSALGGTPLGRGTKTGKGFHTIFFSIWAWDMIFMNNPPEDVHHKAVSALLNMIPYFANYTALTKADLPLRNKVVIMLPHYHQKPSWQSRTPCQTPPRVRFYSAALEAAAVRFRDHLHRIGLLARVDRPDPTGRKIDVVILDLWDWSSQLKPSVENWAWDGAHFSSKRKADLMMGLYQTGLLCNSQARHMRSAPSALLNTKFVRPPDVKRLHYYERFVKHAPWPSLPSCETWRSGPSAVFWPNLRQRLERALWETRDLPKMWKRSRNYHFLIYLYTKPADCPFQPADPRARFQLIHSMVEFPTDPFRAFECANNMNYGENTTSWRSPNVTVANTDYIFWRFFGMTQDEVMVKVNNMKQKDYLPYPRIIPICSCANETHLFPPLHEQLKARFSEIKELAASEQFPITGLNDEKKKISADDPLLGKSFEQLVEAACRPMMGKLYEDFMERSPNYLSWVQAAKDRMKTNESVEA